MKKTKNNTSNLKSNVLITLLAALLIGALGMWLYSNVESHVKEVDKGYSEEARSNKFLAAELFLRKMGVKATKIELFQSDHAPFTHHDTLLIANNRHNFDRKRSKQLLDWVNTGGRLIITAQAFDADSSKFKDHLLNELGLTVVKIEPEEGNVFDAKVLDVDIDDENFWQVNFINTYSILETDKFNSDVIWRIKDGNTVHGLQIKIGQGKITLLSDMLYFTNDFIDQYDHAEFLFLLVTNRYESEKNGDFYYSLSENNPMLVSWLWLNAPYFLMSLTLLVVLILWMKIPRFGPIINIAQPVRRQFIEHLYAAGRYQWQQKFHNRLLMDVRQQLSQSMGLKYPEWINASKNEQIKIFSDHTNLSTQIIEKSLFDLNISKENEFVYTIKTLEKLRKSI